MKKLFRELISENNNKNEQAFVGLVSFFAMIFVLMIDVITGILGKELIIKEFIFDGFMTLTLGAFFINTLKNVMGKKIPSSENENVSVEEEQL
jgi:hypothetical protein